MPLARTLPRTAGLIVAWALVAVIVLIAACAVFAITFDWNRARPWVDDKVSQAIGRPFAINGDLRVNWQHPVSERGWRAWIPWPRFSAYRISVGNPPWTKTPHFATADEIAFTVEVLPLFAHRIIVPSIDLTNPSIDLERLVDGRANWVFQLPHPQQPTRWRLELANLGFANGSIALADALKKVDLQIGIDTLGKPLAIGDVLKQQESASRETAAQVVGKHGARALSAQERAALGASGAAGASTASGASAASTAAPGAASSASSPSASPNPRDLYALAFNAKGTYRTTAVSGSGKIGGVLALRDTTRPFPMQADVKIGDTRLALVGTLTDPLHLAALDLRLWLQGASLSHLYPILGVTLPDTPPYATDGHLSGQFGTEDAETKFIYSGFTGRVGDSDLEGTLTYERPQPRPFLHGQVVSNLLRFADLAPIVGADTNRSKARRGDPVKQPETRALPVEPFRTDRWRAINADVTFTGKRILKDPALPISDLHTHVLLKDGVLSLKPLRFGVAGGTLAMDTGLDGSRVPLNARMSMSARHLKLKQLFPSHKTMQSALGEINGDAALSATGNSPAALAATLDGEVKALVTHGTVSRLLMEEAGLNVANIVYEKLFGHRDVNIRCGVADFTASDGVLDSRTFALDTEDALIAMDGRIDLRNETMNLTIHPQTKGFRVFSLRSPLYVKGTFKHPDVGVSKEALALRAGAAVGLGLLNPFAALLPLMAPSHNQPAPCETLIARMREAPHAPPPSARPKPPDAAAGTSSALPAQNAPVNGKGGG
ncbi:AsmA family protein [Trinickia sp. LjRoot230]|uniref:AsmA family protein n=1 Tax=Trinickia sp. LjRoot230 TaxID=3342288 RepID=UPI003ED0698E